MLEQCEGDPDYWEEVLRRLVLHKAKAKLREVQAQLMTRTVAEMAAGTSAAAAAVAADKAAAAGTSKAYEEEEIDIDTDFGEVIGLNCYTLDFGEVTTVPAVYLNFQILQLHLVLNADCPTALSHPKGNFLFGVVSIFLLPRCFSLFSLSSCFLVGW